MLSFPSDNVTAYPAFPTKYLENNLILSLSGGSGELLEVRAHNKVKEKHFASYISDRTIWVQRVSVFLYLNVWMTQRDTLQNRAFFLSFNRSL